MNAPISHPIEPVAEKLAKLFRMLSSDREGEVTAALEAIKRTIQGANLAHDLGDLIEGFGPGNLKKFYTEAEAKSIWQQGIANGEQRARAQVDLNGFGFRSVDSSNSAGDPPWDQIARACQAYGANHPMFFRSDREKEFVDDMVRQTVHGGGSCLTHKQADWLRKIYARVR